LRVAIGNTRLFFDVEGPGLVPDGPAMRDRPTLLVLHGGPGFDHSGFKPLFSAAARFAQVVYYDHRGHGRSDAAHAAEWNLARWADDVRDLCAALGIERPFVYGLSFGGMVAQTYLTRHPDHPAGVIIDSSGPRMRLDLSYQVFERLGGTRAREIAERFWTQPTSVEAWNDYLAVCLPLYQRTPHDPQAIRRVQLRRDVYEHFFGLDGEGRRFDLRTSLGRVRCPVLVLSGDDDPITPPALVAETAESIPAGLARLETFASTGHAVYREQPQRVFALLESFLAGS
jgi:proline-specific peptidase